MATRIRKTDRIAPALGIDPRDIGQRYMLAHHRKAIAEFLGIPAKEFPAKMKAQIVALQSLKAEDPAQYNYAFDIIVRKIQIGEQATAPEPKQAPAAEHSADLEKATREAVETLKNVGDEKQTELANAALKILENAKDIIHQKITEEAKQFRTVEFQVKATDGKIKKVKGPLPGEFQKILDLASQRINILLVGPSGCGKSHVSKVLAESLGFDFAAQSCSAGMSESAFSGWLLPTAANGQFEYVQSEFVRLYENGGVFLIDEIDAADANMMLFLNQALANGEFYLPQRYKKPLVKRHKNFIAIAAANTMGSGATALYSGRNLMDGATMDRFRMGVVEMDYSPEVEESIVEKEILNWGRTLRHIISKKSLRKIMSTRLLSDATKMKSVGWSLGQIEESYFSDWSREEKYMVQNSFEYQELKRGL